MRKKVLIIAAVVVLVCALGLLRHLGRKAKERSMADASRAVSETNLNAIGTAIAIYALNSEEPPASFEELLKEKVLEPGTLISPSSGRYPEKVTIDENGVLSEPSDYIYIALPSNAPGDLIQAYENPGNYKDSPWGEGTLVLFKTVEGREMRVEWMDIKQFRRALTRTKKWLAKVNFKPGPTQQEQSKKNLRLIGEAIAYFRNTYSAPPASLEDIFVRMSDDMGHGLPEHSKCLRALVSPASGRVPLKTDEKGVPAEPGDYVYIPLPSGAPDTLIQLYEKPENYKDSELGDGTMVLFYNKDEYGPREIKWLDLDTFNTTLEQTQKWVADHNYGPDQATLAIETTRRSWSMDQLWRIALRIESYRFLHNNWPPPSLERLGEWPRGDEYFAAEKLISPISGREPLLQNKSGKLTGKSDYVLIPLPESAPDGLIEIYERPENYAGTVLGEGTIVSASIQGEPKFGHIEWMKIEVFRQKLARTEQWLADNGFGPEWQNLLSWEANRTDSAYNLRGLVKLASVYEKKDQGNVATLANLLSNKYLNTDDLISPVSGRDLAEAKRNRDSLFPSELSDYVYVTLPRNAPGYLIQAYEKPEYYNDSPWGKGTIVMLKSKEDTGFLRMKVKLSAATTFPVGWMDIESLQVALGRTRKWLAEHKESADEGE